MINGSIFALPRRTLTYLKPKPYNSNPYPNPNSNPHRSGCIRLSLQGWLISWRFSKNVRSRVRAVGTLNDSSSSDHKINTLFKIIYVYLRSVKKGYWLVWPQNRYIIQGKTCDLSKIICAKGTILEGIEHIFRRIAYGATVLISKEGVGRRRIYTQGDQH